MNKLSVILMAFSMLLSACSNEGDEYIQLSTQENKQYCEAVAGAYEAKGYSALVVWKDFNNVEDIVKQAKIDDVRIDIFDYNGRDIIFWDVPVNSLADILPENSDERRILERFNPISFTTYYGLERNVQSMNGEKMVNFTFKPVPYYASYTYGGQPHQITLQISPCGIYLPYSSDMNVVRKEFLKSELRFDITSMKIDDKEYKNFDMMVILRIAEESE